MKKHLLPLFLLAFASLLGACSRTEADYLITGALVYDGTMSEPRVMDVAIHQDRIVYVGKKGDARVAASNRIDASGLVLAPGFIDPHTHALADLNSTTDRSLQAWLWQGVTTVFEGNDGSGPYPIGETLEHWAAQGIGVNAGLFVGHGTVRRMVMGPEDRHATADELTAMQDLVVRAMEEGAFGLSSGLFYSPGSFAPTTEVIALAGVAAAYGGIYDTHMRDEGSYGIGLLASVKETIEIGEQAGIPVHISHIKALGRGVWGASEEVISLVEEARGRGLQVTANQYPYPASKTSLKAAVVPRWAEDGGNRAMIARFDDPGLAAGIRAEMAENIHIRGGADALVFTSPTHARWHARSLEDVARDSGLDPVEAAIMVLKVAPGIGVVSFNMHEDDIRRFMQQPWVVTGSDGGSGHPRKFGSFPRKIREYVLEKNYLSMTEMIHRSSGLTATILQLADRGFVREGYYADIILFRPEKVIDLATFEEPAVYASGMEYVFVNGSPAVFQGEYTGKLAGRALKLQ